LYAANMTLGVNTLTIFGKSVPAGIAAGQVTMFVGFWDGSAYQCTSTTIQGGLTTGIVTASNLAAIAANSMFGNNTGGTAIPTVLSAAQVAAMIQGSLSIPTGSIANGAVTTAKLDQTLSSEAVTTATIRDGAVTNNKMANMAGATIKGKVSGAAGVPQDLTPSQVKTLCGLTYDVVHVQVSFEAGELGSHEVIVPYEGTIVNIGTCVVGAIEATDNGTITTRISSSFGGASSPVTNGVLTILAGDGVGTTQQQAPTGGNVFGNNVSNALVLNSSKTTPGGKVLVSVVIQRA
jgi:hypothetical protein